MVSKRYNGDRLIELNSYYREGKSMKDELLTAEAGGPSQYWREWWVWLPQQLNRVFKRIYKAHAQSRLFFSYHIAASSSSMAASLLTLTSIFKLLIWLVPCLRLHLHPAARRCRPLFH